MSERRISLSVVPEVAPSGGRAHERKPSLSLPPRKQSLTSTALLAAAVPTAPTPARKHSLSSVAMVAAMAVDGTARPATRKPSFTSSSVVLAAAAMGAPPVLPTRKHSLTSAAMVAAVAVSGGSATSPPSSPRERKPSFGNGAAVGLGSSRKPSADRKSLASVGIAAAVAVAGSSRNLLVATPQSAGPATGVNTPSGALTRSPSARHMSVHLSSSSKKQQQQQQQLVSMKATRRSFSSSAALEQRIELFFHVPTHKELQRLRVPRTLTLIGLQALVQREFAIPFEDQRLYWHGDLLEGDEDLAFYDIHDQSVLNLRVRKRYRPIGDIFTKVKTVQFRSSAKADDYEIVEVVAPLPPTHVLFKRLVAVITYLQRLDVLQAHRTQRRVWKQRVAFWEEPTAYPTGTNGGRRRSSLAPLIPAQLKSTRSRSTTSSNGDPMEETPAVQPVPPGFIKLHSGPECVSYVVSLAHTHAIAQRLQLPADQRAPSDLRHIKKWLSSIKFFASASLPDVAMHEIARACTYERFRAGDFLFRQGDIGDHFYILISGCVSLAAYGNGFFATMTPGQCFGEISLFAGNNGLRTASANVNFAAPHAELALLSGDIYRRVINPYKKAVLQTTEKAIYSVPQLRSLPDHIITHIAYASKKLEAKTGRILVNRGEEMNVLVLLIKGEVKVSATAQSATASSSSNQPQNLSLFPVVSVVRAPAVLCQEAVLTNTPSPAPWDIEALDSCTLLCLRTDTISIFLAPRPDIIRALNREHTQRLQDFERRFAQYAPPPPTPKDPGSEKTAAGASHRRRSINKLSRKASYMRLLSSRIFESQNSLLSGSEHRGRGRRGAATQVEFPKILLRGSANSDDLRDEDISVRERIRQAGNNTQAPNGTLIRPLTSPAASPSCADLQDEFLHRALPFSEILDLRDQIQFCSFAAQELEEQDTRGRTRALLRGLRQQPVEEVELLPGSDADGIHFRFTPRPPTSPISGSSDSPLVTSLAQRRNLHTR